MTRPEPVLRYMPGFGNECETEALPGALPQGQNSPQNCPYGLYAEQVSGTSFTAPRRQNKRSWLYRIRPSVLHARRFQRAEAPLWRSGGSDSDSVASAGQFRWGAIPFPEQKLNFIEGVRTIATAGEVDSRRGLSVHALLVTRSMTDQYFYDADGELLVVPQQGGLDFFTEFGRIVVEPGEICVLPRGVKFKALLRDGPMRGFICENYGAPFSLPNLGPIGANCLASPLDFKTPVAVFEDIEKPCCMFVKWGGDFFACDIARSPLDVVAWRGNYAPYKYDLRRFCPIGAALFDHPDPSIFTVLTSPSEIEGTANVDFAIFSDRWLVAEHTFRPPWYHVNAMSEFMGLIYGRYDAKPQGFGPGGMSLHNAMIPHGPDAAAFEIASRTELKPERLSDTLAFMFESRFPQRLTKYAAELDTLEKDYSDCWSELPKRFTGAA
ncbi:homogentisate 1,2-dioxygenase [Methylocystis heyeri]|uniref:Homogentisate 1,2-dioxygenase n=1 Tax=Methylocystis heyeri TaxID=391905 RepID=A0A6B8KHV0_9HYPH|nr:homogentisate 1,2-dioxygenase [Methylocystis heyeri]QGM47237.1 homogentisate 1,2-dioxygenase [Methylocystis heyeri]